MAGALFVVATPIGNLEDLTFRALRTLREVNLIAAEDTRRTSNLLAHYEVHKPLVSLHEHNEARETPRLVTRIAGGETIALVSDAGTPGIADPGTRLVRAVRDAGLKVIPIPGASAIAAALSASGYPADEFVFLGFPPSSGPKREAWLKRLAGEARTAVLFEAPHRIERTLQDMRHVLANRPTTTWREITKIHEESIEQPSIAPNIEMLAKGEFTVVVAPAGRPADATDIGPGRAKLALELFGQLTNTERSTREVAIGITSRALGMDRLEVKRLVKRHVMSGK